MINAKKVIIASRIGEAHDSRENFPRAKNENKRMITQTMTQTINEVISAIKTLIASYFGGARISSGVRLSMFSGESIRTKYKKSTN